MFACFIVSVAHTGIRKHGNPETPSIAKHPEYSQSQEQGEEQKTDKGKPVVFQMLQQAGRLDFLKGKYNGSGQEKIPHDLF